MTILKPSNTQKTTSVPKIEDPTINFESGLGGMGDLACAMWVAEGIQQLGLPVKFYCNTPEVPNLFGIPSVPNTREGKRVDINTCYNHNLAARVAENMPRIQWYWNRLAHFCPSIREGEPKQPQLKEFHVDERFKDQVLVFPMAAWKNRQWPTQQYQRMVGLLRDQGIPVILLVPRGDEAAVKGFHKTKYYYGMSWSGVVNAIKNAKLVICNDSGPAHIAGLTNTPCVPIHAIYSPKILWSFYSHHYPLYPDVTPDTPCVGCGWVTKKGYRSFDCSEWCTALNSITAHKAFHHVKRILTQIDNGELTDFFTTK